MSPGRFTVKDARLQRLLSGCMSAGDKVVDWSPFQEKPEVPRPCLCPACEGSTESKCANCLSEGIVY